MQNVDVMAAFGRNGTMLPKVFRYGNQTYRVENVSLAHSIRKGASKVLVFNVADGANHWTLIYDSENLLWKLDDGINEQ